MLWAAGLVTLSLTIGICWFLFFRNGVAPGPATAPPPAPPQSRVSVPVNVGDVLTPAPSCSGSAADAKGVADDDGRLSSPAGLSVPSPEGFTPAPMNYAFVHESNSAVKRYEGTNWVASLTIGTLKAEDGFTSAGESAVHVARCVLASSYEENTSARVLNVEADMTEMGALIEFTAPVEPVEGVPSDKVLVLTMPQDGKMFVVISMVPVDDREAEVAVQESLGHMALTNE